MKVTDVITITELSRLMNKSRPTLYKYISDFEIEQYDDIPKPILELFQNIVFNGYGKKDIYSYCDSHFMVNDALSEIVNLLKTNIHRLNLNRIKEFIEKELE